MSTWWLWMRRSRLSGIPSAWAAALAALAAYLPQAIRFAHRLPSTLDEGNYLYKGLLFATGVYTPFQDYGPWTNKMPLAFLIPGWGQQLFGAGLRSGRYFAIVLSLLMLAGLWLAARRLAGPWWAAAAVWAVAANPGLVAMYSQALSEGVVACQLAWVLALTFGRQRRAAEWLAGAVLSALIVMTRQNMLPLAGFVALYILWEHGWRRGLAAALAIAVVLAAGHALYWPNILNIWRPWLPSWMLGFASLLLAVLAGSTQPTAAAAAPLAAGFDLYPIWDALRYYFVPVFGAVCLWLLWPRRPDWKSPSHFRTAVILSALLVVLAASHAWAALGKDYCPYCLSIYLSFFSEIGLILIAVSFSGWCWQLSPLRNVLAAVVTLGFAAGMGFGAYQVLDDAVLTLQIPRVTGGRILPGSTDLWRSLANKFHLSYETLQRLLPALAGLLVGAAILILALLLARRLRRSSGALALTGLLILGALLSPSALLGGANPVDCGGDVLASYEAAGRALVAEVPPGALVYWLGGLSPAPLLYLPQARVFPPMLNGHYAYLTGPNPDAIYRAGFWNDDLAQQWLAEADVVLVEDRVFDQDFQARLGALRYSALQSTPAVLTCRERSTIRVFRREK